MFTYLEKVNKYLEQMQLESKVSRKQASVFFSCGYMKGTPFSMELTMYNVFEKVIS